MGLRNSVMAFWGVVFLSLVSGCGGGGGGGNGGDGNNTGNNAGNPSPTINFTLSDTAIDGDVVRDTGTQTFAVAVENLSSSDELLVEVPGGRPAWLLPVVSQMNPGSPYPLYTVVARIFTNGLSQGTHRARIRVYTRNRSTAVEGGSRYIDVTVNVAVVERLQFTTQSASTMSVLGSDTAPSAELVIAGNSATAWQATTDQSWLSLSKTSGTGPDVLQAVVDSSGLAPGSYTASVFLTTADPFAPTSFSYTLYLQAPSLSVSGGDGVYSEGAAHFAVINGPDGRGDESTLTLHYALDTGAAAYPYTLSFDNQMPADWLTLTATPDAGTLDGNGVDIQLTVDPGALADGAYAGSLAFSVTVGDTTLSHLINVRYYKEPHRVYAQTRGFAFSLSPGRAVLSRQVRILSSRERTDVPWQASASEPWLSVSSAGLTGDAMTLTIDPAGLTPGAFYEASVAITSTDPGVSGTEVLHVGFDYRAGDGADVTVDLPLGGGVADAFRPYLVESPTQPLVYVGVGNTLDAYHVVSGALVRSFGNVVTATGPMTISDDGLTLFVFDAANLDIVQLDTQSASVVQRFTPFTGYTMTLPGQGYPLHPLFVRPFGAGQLISAGDYAINPDDLSIAQYLNEEYHNEPALAVAPGDASTVVKADGSTKQLRYSAAAGSVTTTDRAAGVEPAADAVQACVNSQQTQLFTSNAQTGQFSVTDIALQQLAQALVTPGAPLGLRCGWNGLVVAAIVSAVATDDDIFMFDESTGALLGSVRSAPPVTASSLYRNALVISGDGTRVVALTDTAGGPDKLVLRSTP